MAATSIGCAVVETDLIHQTLLKASDLDEAMELFEANAGATYSVVPVLFVCAFLAQSYAAQAESGDSEGDRETGVDSLE